MSFSIGPRSSSMVAMRAANSGTSMLGGLNEGVNGATKRCFECDTARILHVASARKAIEGQILRAPDCRADGTVLKCSHACPHQARDFRGTGGTAAADSFGGRITGATAAGGAFSASGPQFGCRGSADGAG